jgi:hypothetical protein
VISPRVHTIPPLVIAALLTALPGGLLFPVELTVVACLFCKDDCLHLHQKKGCGRQIRSP